MSEEAPEGKQLAKLSTSETSFTLSLLSSLASFLKHF